METLSFTENIEQIKTKFAAEKEREQILEQALEQARSASSLTEKEKEELYKPKTYIPYAKIDITKFIDALHKLVCEHSLSQYKTLDQLPVQLKEGEGEFDQKDVLLMFNQLYGLGCLLLELVCNRQNPERLCLLLAVFEAALKGSYEVIETKEEE